MTNWDFPHGIDASGRTATTDRDDHVRDLVEQVLLTSPGERLMRPDFGAGLLAMVFEPGGPEVATTLQHLAQGALERWLGDVIAVRSLTVEAVDAALVVTVAYVVRATREERVDTIELPGGGG